MTSAEPNAPLDLTHSESMTAISWIRGLVVEAKLRAAKWEPKPMPKDWR